RRSAAAPRTRWSGCGRSPRSAICGLPMSPGRSSALAARGGHGTGQRQKWFSPAVNRRAEPPEGQSRADRGRAPACRLAPSGTALFLDVLFDYLLGGDRLARARRLLGGLPLGLSAFHDRLPLGGQPPRVGGRVIA